MSCHLSMGKWDHKWEIKGAGLMQMDSCGLAVQRGLGWKLDNCEYWGPDMAPILTKPHKGRKAKPSPLCLQHPGRPAKLARWV